MKPFFEIPVGKLYNGNNVGVLKSLLADIIDLTITSPPYDNMRDYEGYSWDYKALADELLRITKPGGIVVWVVGDATVDGSETCTSAEQKIYFRDIGWRVHDTMIYEKTNFSAASNNRYHQIFEYMFIFSKGKPKTFNPLMDRKNIWAGTSRFGKNTRRDVDGSMIELDNTPKTVTEYGMRNNIWRLKTAAQENICQKLEHPAMYPRQLVHDHLLSWSNEGDLILDPFLGSGTTALECIELDRNFIGIEISEKYCEMIKKDVGKAYEKKISRTPLFDF